LIKKAAKVDCKETGLFSKPVQVGASWFKVAKTAEAIADAVGSVLSEVVIVRLLCETENNIERNFHKKIFRKL